MVKIGIPAQKRWDDRMYLIKKAYIVKEIHQYIQNKTMNNFNNPN